MEDTLRRQPLRLALALLSAVWLLTMMIGGAHRSASAASNCPLINGDFEASTFAPWYLQVDEANGAEASLAGAAGYDSPNAAHIQIDSRGTDNWHIQISQRNVKLSAGRRYTLSFWARATQPRVISAQLQQYGQPYTELWKQAFGLNESWQLLETVIDYPDNAVTLTPVFRFDVGQTTGGVWIDDVALCESDTQPNAPTPIPVARSCGIVNGDFESDPLAPWSLNVSAPAQATLRWDAGARSTRAARIDITRAGPNPGAVQLSQERLPMRPNAWMALGFHARASVGRTLAFELIDGAGQPIWRKSVRLVHPLSDANFRHHFFAFKTPGTINAGTATLNIHMGDVAGAVWLDAIHLCEAPQRFADEFDDSTGPSGTVDPGKWQPCKAYTENCAEMNYGVQSWYKASNAQVNGGTLKMLTTRERNTVCIGCKFNAGKPITRDYASVYLQTNASFTPQYGFMEARMKMPTARGLWPAFWLHPKIAPTGNVRWPPEIDVMEFYTNRPDRVWNTLHYNTSTQFNVSHGRQYLLGDLSSDFHTYAMNWTPYEIIWYVDGAETFRSSRALIREPMFLILDVEVGGPAGTPDADMTSGAVTEVDYVRVFDNSRAFGYGDHTINSNATPTPAPKATPTPNSGAALRAQVIDGQAEQPLSRWRIQVFQGNRLSVERDSDANGWVSFALAPDRYRVCEVVMTGWQNRTPGQAGCYWLTLRAGDNTELRFENMPAS